MVVLLEVIIGFLILWVIMTQVFTPLWFNRPIFPAFREKAKVEGDIILTKEEIEVGKLQKKLDALKNKIKESQDDR